ncbi:MAG: hypothetical protein VB080_11745 [Propionicimonas sp.]|uniref:hypothetical protein n=1 Tax=Propionicimonas sp. TaxID=1955623 RepID=UPI002B20EA62|nr:hypothetical protein [Propionicimonas sp.]MEA4945095.1 hypothetical protein [Propionicimonas sp.]MEA5055659.1 hypothetical protein [Propionicimonas sp.]
MTTILGEETSLLLAIQVPEDDTAHREAALENLSATVVTRLALKAKADSYRVRIDRWLAIAANQGASLDELAAAAGMSRAEVQDRLAATPDGLLTEGARRRLAADARSSGAPAEVPATDEITVDTRITPPAGAPNRRFGWRPRSHG